MNHNKTNKKISKGSLILIIILIIILLFLSIKFFTQFNSNEYSDQRCDLIEIGYCEVVAAGKDLQIKVTSAREYGTIIETFSIIDSRDKEIECSTTNSMMLDSGNPIVYECYGVLNKGNNNFQVEVYYRNHEEDNHHFSYGSINIKK